MFNAHTPQSHTPQPNADRVAPTTVVLLDPTSPDGESALDLLRDDDHHVALVVLLSGRSSSALREFAHAEDTSVADAGWYYLEQVAERAARPNRLIESIPATGPDVYQELAYLATTHQLGRVLLPASIMRHHRHLPYQLARLTPASITVAQLVGAS
jgi:hypothetical protein